MSSDGGTRAFNMQKRWVVCLMLLALAIGGAWAQEGPYREKGEYISDASLLDRARLAMNAPVAALAGLVFGGRSKSLRFTSTRAL